MNCTVRAAVAVLLAIACSLPPVQAGSLARLDCSTPARASKSVVINEVLYDPAGDEAQGEFVELCNVFFSPVNLLNWTLSDSDGTMPYDMKFPSLVLATGRFVVVYTGTGSNETDFSDGAAHLYLGLNVSLWTNTGDDVLLRDGNLTGVDYLAYGEGMYVDLPPADLSWSGPNKVASEGRCLARIPSGQDTDSGTDWSNRAPTPGMDNGYEPPSTAVINEIMPRPARDWNGDNFSNTQDEWVEVHNTNTAAAANLSRLVLDDDEGGSPPYRFPDNSYLASGAFLTLFNNRTGIGQNNDHDTVRLLDPFGNVLSCCTYQSPRTDVSFGRIPDGTGNFRNLTVPTPGLPNILDDPPDVTNVSQTPLSPSEFDDVTVLATITDDHGYPDAFLEYALNNGSARRLPMIGALSNYSAVIPAQANGTFVSYSILASDTRNQTSERGASWNYAVARLPEKPLNISAFFNATSFLRGSSGALLGNVANEPGSGAPGAVVRAVLWGGSPLGNGTADGDGNFSVLFRAPDSGGNHTVNITAAAGARRGFLQVTLRVVTVLNKLPVISGVVRIPQDVTPVDDVLVCATVRDENAVRGVWLNYRAGTNGWTRVAMNRTVAPDAYIASIPVQLLLTDVSYFIEAWDEEAAVNSPEGAPLRVYTYLVSQGHASSTEFLRFVASLNSTECFVGARLMAGGYLTNATSFPLEGVSVTVTFDAHPELGTLEGPTESMGVFALAFCAPMVPGNYTVRIGCSAGTLSNATHIVLRVRDTLRISFHLSELAVEPGSPFTVTGTVLRADGSPAAGANITVYFAGGKYFWKTVAGNNGSFNVTVRAPSRDKTAYLGVNATYADVNTAVFQMLEIRAPNRTPGASGLFLLVALWAAAIIIARRCTGAGST